MRTPEEVLAQLGIDEHHTGPFTYQELREAVQHTLQLEARYRENVMRAVRSAPDPEWVRQEQAKGEAWLMSPAQMSETPPSTKLRDDPELGGFAGMNIRLIPYDPSVDHPPF